MNGSGIRYQCITQILLNIIESQLYIIYVINYIKQIKINFSVLSVFLFVVLCLWRTEAGKYLLNYQIYILTKFCPS